MGVAFDWVTLSTTTGAKTPSGRFWLDQNKTPVEAGQVQAAKVASWDVDPLSSLPVAATKPNLNEVIVPPGVTHVRVDITLRVTAKGATKTGLDIRQLFNVGTGGALTPAAHSLDNRPWAASSTGPTRPSAAGALSRRTIPGLHPLLSATPGGFTVDARFLDLTELWWTTHTDTTGRYLHKVLKGRMENLRVLGWTGGDLPTIWFAVLSDMAVRSLRGAGAPPANKKPTRSPADIVWIRPPAGMNAFAYSADLKGFEHKNHDSTTWWNLTRWLLSPAGKDRVSALSGLANFEEVLDQMQRPPSSSKTPVADGMAAAWSHRPVGLERVLSRTEQPDVVLMPLGADTAQGYAAATRSGLPARVVAAMRLLWSTASAGRTDSAPPTSGRKLWLAAHSGANFSLAAALAANAAGVDRVISHEASGPGVLDAVVNAVSAESGRRKKAGVSSQLEAVFVVTPHMTGDPAGLTPGVRKRIDATGAKILHLPDPAEAAEFWRVPPRAKTLSKANGNLGTASATDMIEDSGSPAMRYFFENFFESDMYDASGKPRVNYRNFRIWLVHEMAVFFGHLDPLPTTPGPDPPRTMRTLLADSLSPY